MSDIKSIIETTVAEKFGNDYITGEYQQAILAVTEALVEREYAIFDNIASVGVQILTADGDTGTAIETMLTEAGLSQRPKPVAVPEPAKETEPTTLEDRMALMEGQLAQLLQVAKRLAPSEF